MAEMPLFDPSEVPPAESFELIPPGWYVASIIKSEMKETKAGTGSYLSLELLLDENRHPELKGRKLWTNLNLVHQNPKAVTIARRDLSAICVAVGVTEATSDSEVLHFKPMAIKVAIKPADGKYEASSEVKTYEPVAGRFSGGAAAAPQQAAPPASMPEESPW